MQFANPIFYIVSSFTPTRFFPPDNIQSVSLPVQLQCEAIGSTSSEQGSISPDCDSKHDVFFQKKKSSGSENLLKPPNSNYLRSELSRPP